MDKIKLNEITETVCKLYNKSGEYVCTIESHLELNDIRIQIMKAKVDGYYIIWERFLLYIDKSGKLDEWPKGFYDTFDNQLDILIGLK